MDIHFHHTDHYLNDIWDLEETHKIAEIVIANKELLTDFADFILNSTTIKKYKTRRVEMLTAYNNSPLNKILKLFKQALKKININGENKRDNLNRLRGAILEILIYQIVLDRFEQNAHNCRVKINSKTINHNGKKTIDIACYSKKENKATFFECKVHPYWFNDKEFGYLNKLFSSLNEDIKDLLVAGVSLDYEIFVENKFNENNIKNIRPFGRRKIEELIENIDGVA